MSAALSTREPRFDQTAAPSSRMGSRASRSARSRYRVKLRGEVAGKNAVISVYLVVADSPEEAYYSALRYEPTATRRLMSLYECDFVERVVGAKTGIESILARFSVPPPPAS